MLNLVQLEGELTSCSEVKKSKSEVEWCDVVISVTHKFYSKGMENEEISNIKCKCFRKLAQIASSIEVGSFVRAKGYLQEHIIKTDNGDKHYLNIVLTNLNKEL